MEKLGGIVTDQQAKNKALHWILNNGSLQRYVGRSIEINPIAEEVELFSQKLLIRGYKVSAIETARNVRRPTLWILFVDYNGQVYAPVKGQQLNMRKINI